MKYIAACIILFLLTWHAKASLYYKQFNTASGLISNTVYSVVRDHNGYIWFTTDKGVAKFDGKNFKNFTIVNGLGDNEVFNAYEDKKHRLWLYTYNGTPCYISNDRVYNPTNDSFIRKLPAYPFINGMYEDGKSLYITYAKGQIVKITDTNVNIINSAPIEGNHFYTAYPVDSNVFFISRSGRFEAVNNKLTNCLKIKKNVSFYRNGKVLQADDEGVKIYKNDKLLFKYNDTEINLFNTNNLYLDENQNIFCCTNNGLIIVNMKSGSKRYLLPEENTTCINTDIYGNYWLSTLGGGVYLLNKHLEQISLLNDHIDKYKVFYTKNNQLFFAQKDSLFTLTGDKDLAFSKLNLPYQKGIIPLYLTDTFFLYMNSNKDISGYYNFITQKAAKLPFFVKNVLQYKPGNILVTGLFNICDIDIHASTPVIKKEITFANRIIHTEFGFKNNVYFVSNNELYEFSLPSYSLTRIDSLSSLESVINIYAFDDKVILFTNKQRLLVYKTTGHFNKGEISITSPTIFSIYNLLNGKILLSTDQGYFIAENTTNFKKDIGKLIKLDYPFSQRDILFLYPYKNQIVCNVSGKLYSFDQTILNSEIDTPKLLFNSITINDRKFSSNNIALHNVTNSLIHLSLGTLYFNSGENHFEYRIMGDKFSGKWHTQNSSDIDILIGNTGTYEIEYRVVTDNNIPSRSGHLHVILYSPFYFTYTFYAIVLLLLTFLIMFVVYKIGIKRKKVFESELNYLQLENKAMNSLMTPHFVFNAINNIQNLINVGSQETANNYLVSLSKLMRQNIENLQFHFIDIEKELNLVTNYVHLQNLRFDNRINLIIKQLQVMVDVKIPPLLIHTFVENSIVHGFRPHVHEFIIVVELDISIDDKLIIKITDNGIGFNKKEFKDPVLFDQTSLGISFTQKRLQRLSDFYKEDYSFQIRSLNNEGQKGTEVIIVLSAKFEEPHYA